MSSETNPWWLAAISGVVSVAGWWIGQRGGWMATRASQVTAQVQATTAREKAIMDAYQSLATQAQEAREREGAALRLRIEALEREVEAKDAQADRYRELARAWNRVAHDLWHQRGGLAHVVLSIYERVSGKRPDVPTYVPLPPLESPPAEGMPADPVASLPRLRLPRIVDVPPEPSGE